MELQNIIYNESSEFIYGLNGTEPYELPLFSEMTIFEDELEIYLSMDIKTIVFQLTEEQYGPYSQPRMVVNFEEQSSMIVNFSDLPSNLHIQLENIILIIKSEL